MPTFERQGVRCLTTLHPDRDLTELLQFDNLVTACGSSYEYGHAWRINMQTTQVRQRPTFAESGLIGASVDDPQMGLRIALYSPQTHPKEWALYLDQAEASYGTHGVACAVRRRQLETEPCPAFWHIEDLKTGQVVGGMRAHGPYPTVESVWGLQEFASFPAYDELAAIVEPLLPGGVVENKGAYMAVDAKPSHDVPAVFVRCMSMTIEVVNARALIGTSARHTLPLWTHAGCEIPRPDLKVPYPDDRYETVFVLHETRRRKELMSRQVRVQRIRDIAALRREEIEVGVL